MPKVHSILMLSNGHGEDIIGSNILDNLFSKEENLYVSVLPIVGMGDAYKNLPVKMLGPTKNLPTGGFMRQSIKNFVTDVKGGILGLTYRQIQTLRKVSESVDTVICVGDLLLVILAGLFIKKDMIFLPTAKSEYISGHYKIEEKLMGKYVSLVLPRDEKTAKALREEDINAKFVGNAMMDSLDIKGVDFGCDEETKLVGILPGSRDEAYQNMKMILKVIENLEDLKSEEMDYVTALAGRLSLDKLEREINELGWNMNVEADRLPAGVIATLNSPQGFCVKLSKGYFGDVLDKSDIFIGLAGTANEQAVGMGKPLVTFVGDGPQFNEKFVKAQKRLLGDSISVVEPIPEKVATELLVILHDDSRYQAMGDVGKERMGPPGGIDRMTNLMLEHMNFR